MRDEHVEVKHRIKGPAPLVGPYSTPLTPFVMGWHVLDGDVCSHRRGASHDALSVVEWRGLRVRAAQSDSTPTRPRF
jgi:hypothetical protein